MSPLAIVTLSVVFSIGFAFCAARIASLLAWRFMKSSNDFYTYHSYNEPTGEHWFGAWACAIPLAIFWPLFAISYPFRKFLLAPPEDIQTERKARQLEAERKRLEKESERLRREQRELDEMLEVARRDLEFEKIKNQWSRQGA